MELYCHKCIKLSPDIVFKLQDCDCPITEHDYSSTRSMSDCPCDEPMCTDCSNISYSKYRVEADLIIVTCISCKITGKSCCDGGYYISQH
jgi:hypothetical protein